MDRVRSSGSQLFSQSIRHCSAERGIQERLCYRTSRRLAGSDQLVVLRAKM